MDKWFKAFSKRVESYLFFFTVFFIILLILIQALMVREDVRQYLSRVDILEGEPYAYTIKDEEEPSDIASASPLSLTVEVTPPGQKDLKILVNGEEKGVFNDAPLTITVEAGDLVEVSGEVVNGPAVVKVTGAEGLKQPGAGDEIIIFGDNELIGWVIPSEQYPE